MLPQSVVVVATKPGKKVWGVGGGHQGSQGLDLTKWFESSKEQSICFDDDKLVSEDAVIHLYDCFPPWWYLLLEDLYVKVIQSWLKLNF